MELRKYIAVFRRWLWLIVLGTALAGGTALVVSLRMTPVYEAEAGVVVIRTGFQLELEPRFKTLSEEELAQTARSLQEAKDRRDALAAIVKNEAVASQVYAELGERFDPLEIEGPADLVGMVSSDTEGDMIRIKVRYRDPQLVADLANAWARSYEQYVNRIYGGQPAPAAIQEQVVQVKQQYDAAEAKLVAFIRDNQIDQLNRQIQEKQAVLAKLQEARQTTVAALIDEELQGEGQIITEYLRRYFQNRLTAFQKEQDAKSQLLTSYLDAAITERQKVFNEQLQANLARLSEAYARRHQVDRLLVDARALRERLQSSTNSASAAASNALALLLLQTSAFTQSADPITSQLDLRVHINELPTIFSEPEQLNQDLDNLIALLEKKRTEYDQEIQTLSGGLLNSENLDYLEEGPLAGGALMDAIHTKYPDLFELGTLSDLAESVGVDTPLVKTMEERAQSLFKLKGLQDTLSLSTLNEPTSKVVTDLQDELKRLQAELELQQDQQRELTGARDLAWQSYVLLANKAEEVSIAAATAEGTEVRFAVTATAPHIPVQPRTLLNTLQASVVGAMLALGVVFLLEYMDDTLRLPADVGRVLELPTLGLVPRGATTNDARPVAINQPAAPVAEAVRMLRTGLGTLRDRPHSLLITSAGRGEGKTSVAANLAVVMAQAGRSVILVDADLRHPALHQLFDVPNAAGLTTLLRDGDASIEPFLQATGVARLRVLPAGPETDRPAELLGSPRMQELLVQLRDAAEVIVLDSPAAGAVTDAAVLAPQMDGMLLVVAAGTTPAGQVQGVRDTLEAVGGRVLGVVLNGVPGAAWAYSAYADGKRTSPFGFPVPLPGPLARGLERLLMLFR